MSRNVTRSTRRVFIALAVGLSLSLGALALAQGDGFSSLDAGFATLSAVAEVQPVLNPYGAEVTSFRAVIVEGPLAGVRLRGNASRFSDADEVPAAMDVLALLLVETGDITLIGMIDDGSPQGARLTGRTHLSEFGQDLQATFEVPTPAELIDILVASAGR